MIHFLLYRCSANEPLPSLVPPLPTHSGPTTPKTTGLPANSKIYYGCFLCFYAKLTPGRILDRFLITAAPFEHCEVIRNAADRLSAPLRERRFADVWPKFIWLSAATRETN